MKAIKIFKSTEKGGGIVTPVYLWLAGALIYGLLRSFLAKTLVLDDTRFWMDFVSNYDQSGNLVSALLAVLFNADYMAYTGDFRTYGLSRFIHVLIMLVSHDNVKVYAFIIGFSHIISGFFLCNILKHLIRSRDCIFFCVSIYIFSPFVRVQSFHHFSYLMLPFYFLLAFTSYELSLSSHGKATIKNLKFMVISALFVLTVTFTGESTLPMLFFVLFLMLLREKRSHNKNGCFKYLFLMFWECFLFAGYYLLYNRFINLAQNDRFQAGMITLTAGVTDYIKSSLKALSTFLFFPAKYSSSVESYAAGITFSHFSVWIALCVVAASVACMAGIFFSLYKKKDSEQQHSDGPDFKVVVIALVFVLSSTVMYIGLEVFTQSFSQPARYFYVTLTLALIFLIIASFSILQKHAARIFSSVVLVVCVGYLTIWCACFLAETKEGDTQILAFLDKAEAEGIDNIVFITVVFPGLRRCTT